MENQAIPTSLQEKLKKAPQITLQEGQRIFHQGQACEQYFILREGQARVFTRSANGKEVLLYHMNPGEICILTTACLLSNKSFPAEAIANSDLSTYVLNKAQFDAWLAESADFRQLIFSGFGQRLNGLIETISKLALEGIDQRLAKLLLRQEGMELAWTHQQIADDIGSAREVVSRHLKKMAEMQWVELGRGKLRILNRDALIKLSLG